MMYHCGQMKWEQVMIQKSNLKPVLIRSPNMVHTEVYSEIMLALYKLVKVHIKGCILVSPDLRMFQMTTIVDV